MRPDAIPATFGVVVVRRPPQLPVISEEEKRTFDAFTGKEQIVEIADDACPPDELLRIRCTSL